MRKLLLTASIAALLTGQAHKVEILSFTSNPPKIHPGQSAYLEWKTRGVDTVTLDTTPDDTIHLTQHRSGLPASGTLEVKPKINTRYMLGCESTDGYACASLSVTVEVR